LNIEIYNGDESPPETYQEYQGHSPPQINKTAAKQSRTSRNKLEMIPKQMMNDNSLHVMSSENYNTGANIVNTGKLINQNKIPRKK
jgi:hypothetical protein